MVTAESRTGFPIMRAALVVGLALVATLPSLNAPLYLDAVSRIGLNPDIRDLANLGDRLVYPPSKHFNFDRNDPSRPVVFALYTLIWSVWPHGPIGFRLLNLLVHALNGLLVYLCCRALFRFAFARPRDWLAVAAAAAFVSSPVNVGTAVYTYALTDLLAMTFSVAALLAFVRWRNRPAWWGSVSAVCLLLGLFSKQSVAVLPALLLALDFLTADKPRSTTLRKHGLAHLALFALVVAYVIWRKRYFGQIGDVEGTSFVWNRWAYIKAQPEVILRYLGFMFVPIGLSIDHPFAPIAASDVLLHVLIPWAIVVAQFVGTIRLASGRTAFQAACGFALLWFFLQLAPTSSIFPTVDAMVGRRVYAPSMGIYLFLAIAIGRALDLREQRRSIEQPSRWAMLPVGLLLGIFVAVSCWQSYLFRDRVKTWKRVLAMYPNSVRALSSLAAGYLDHKDYAHALPLFARATQLQDYSFSSWFNLGSIYENSDSGFFDPARAIQMYRKTLEINPGYALAYFRLARLLHMHGDLDEAARLYQKSIDAGLEQVDSLNNLGLIEARLGHDATARAHFRRALELAPDYQRARENLRLLAEGRLRSSGAPSGTGD